LISPKDIYVNVNTGSDTLYDGSQATVDAVNGHGPYKTLQKASNTTQLFNLNGFNITVHVADGVYDRAGFTAPGGTGAVILTGNPTTPGNCLVHSPAGVALAFSGAGWFYIDGFALRADANIPAQAEPGNGIFVFNGANAEVRSVECQFCYGTHMAAQNKGLIAIAGPVRITGPTNWAHVSSSYSSHVGTYITAPPTYTILSPLTFGQAFADAQTLATMFLLLGSVTGYGNVNGPKFSAIGNAVINVNGNGASYLPGTVGGSLSTGAQYI
jgi:hypothetical protein